MLEIENNSLRASLRSAQEELAPLKCSNPVPVTNPNANEVKELRAKISKLEEQVVKLQVDVKSESQLVASKQEEIKRLSEYLNSKSSGDDIAAKELEIARSEIGKLAAQVELVKRDSAKESQSKLQQVHSANELHIKVCSDQECTVTYMYIFRNCH